MGNLKFQTDRTLVLTRDKSRIHSFLGSCVVTESMRNDLGSL
ncbi:uncharacterized protein G2W53_028625 [Senna tora]|uniref:Uncharacterized protein n=1 Tax=Senna tora TaxID=362788 RepID=A0A834WD00_9FABA|nr:uncharacterized protein G2W53_028625 [Senna tora]